jgi:hypothetical protein
LSSDDRMRNRDLDRDDTKRQSIFSADFGAHDEEMEQKKQKQRDKDQEILAAKYTSTEYHTKSITIQLQQLQGLVDDYLRIAELLQDQLKFTPYRFETTHMAISTIHNNRSVQKALAEAELYRHELLVRNQLLLGFVEKKIGGNIDAAKKIIEDKYRDYANNQAEAELTQLKVALQNIGMDPALLVASAAFRIQDLDKKHRTIQKWEWTRETLLELDEGELDKLIVDFDLDIDDEYYEYSSERKENKVNTIMAEVNELKKLRDEIRAKDIEKFYQTMRNDLISMYELKTQKFENLRLTLLEAKEKIYYQEFGNLLNVMTAHTSKKKWNTPQPTSQQELNELQEEVSNIRTRFSKYLNNLKKRNDKLKQLTWKKVVSRSYTFSENLEKWNTNDIADYVQYSDVGSKQLEHKLTLDLFIEYLHQLQMTGHTIQTTPKHEFVSLFSELWASNVPGLGDDEDFKKKSSNDLGTIYDALTSRDKKTVLHTKKQMTFSECLKENRTLLTRLQNMQLNTTDVNDESIKDCMKYFYQIRQDIRTYRNTLQLDSVALDNDSNWSTNNPTEFGKQLIQYFRDLTSLSSYDVFQDYYIKIHAELVEIGLCYSIENEHFWTKYGFVLKNTDIDRSTNIQNLKDIDRSTNIEKNYIALKVRNPQFKKASKETKHSEQQAESKETKHSEEEAESKETKHSEQQAESKETQQAEQFKTIKQCTFTQLIKLLQNYPTFEDEEIIKFQQLFVDYLKTKKLDGMQLLNADFPFIPDILQFAQSDNYNVDPDEAKSAALKIRDTFQSIENSLGNEIKLDYIVNILNQTCPDLISNYWIYTVARVINVQSTNNNNEDLESITVQYYGGTKEILSISDVARIRSLGKYFTMNFATLYNRETLNVVTFPERFTELNDMFDQLLNQMSMKQKQLMIPDAKRVCITWDPATASELVWDVNNNNLSLVEQIKQKIIGESTHIKSLQDQNVDLNLNMDIQRSNIEQLQEQIRKLEKANAELQDDNRNLRIAMQNKFQDIKK